MGKRAEQKQKALELRLKVDKCNSEEDLEKVTDLAEECVQAGYITKKAYRAIEEALDDRLMDLVEEGVV